MRREISFNEIHDAQRYYRLLMDSMARPGKINTFYDKDIFPPADLNKATSLIAFALLNADVFFHYAGENVDAVNNYILLNTSSSPVDAEYADFVFQKGNVQSSVISRMKVGSLAYPEEGATVVMDVQYISSDPLEECIRVMLKGPGVDGEKAVYVKGLSGDMLTELADVNIEFPLGVDLILTDIHNNIICIPRSNRFSWTRN
jgi:alpha-D-ribose 1-methylphosphonate 5-triphosphate synthase subunit PhnH